MKNWLGLALASFIVVVAPFRTEGKMSTTAEKSIYDFKVKNIDGKEVSLKDYSGKTLLIVNTASKCGYTPQYKELEALYGKYKDKGLVVLGFPSNDYGAQEPGTNADIKTFCETKFHVSFPLFDKGPVSGEKIQPLFRYLTQEAKPEAQGEIKWNFEKFVIDRKGRLVERFNSKATPDSAPVKLAVETAIAAK